TNEIDWCEKCFLPHPQCEVDQQVEEADDDACMVDFCTSSQQGATSTEVISVRIVT
ncbi:hypothetical protein KI387_029743, partial [Taxus chinensis]